MSERKLLISLHDITPFHLPRIRKAEALFRDLGLAKVTYLFVPEYHGRYPSVGHREFLGWCREPRPFQVEWHLHGFHHLEGREPAVPGGTLDALKRGFLTAGEGEFLALEPQAQARLLDAGLEAFRLCLEADPPGFVAPAWLFNSALHPLLRERGIRFTEDHRNLYRTDTSARLPSPVITWATRTFLRKYGSLAVCPLLARLFASAPFLRVAMHPFDFDHPSTLRNIRAVLEYLTPGRVQAFSSDLAFPD